MAIIIEFCVTIIICLTLYLIKTIKKPHNYPPGPKFVPYFGNSFQLRNLSRSVGGQHNAIKKWLKKYNSNILGLKLGQELVVIGSSYSVIREIHTRDEFQARPENFFLRLRTMGTRLGVTCTDGAFWAEQRSFCTRHLREVGYGRTPMEHHIQNELNELISIIKEFNEAPVWPGSFLAPSILNVLWALTAGKRIERNDKKLQYLLELLEKRSKAFDLSGGIMSQMPWVRYIAPEKCGYNLIVRFNTEIYKFLSETVQEHNKNYSITYSRDDLIYAYLTEIKEREKNNMNNETNDFTEKQLIMIILDIFIAGSQTTKTTLDLAFMMMVVRTDIQVKIRSEIETMDYDNTTSLYLPYTEAFLLEVQRYFHIAPVTGPRRTLNDTTLGNYNIPKNTTILIHIESVAMDKNYWKDPENFRPERFLDDDMNIIKHEYFMPFGQGKRRCLGDSLARACLKQYFVGIIKNFKLKLPPGEDTPSTTLLPGITLSAKPYKIQFCSI